MMQYVLSFFAVLVTIFVFFSKKVFNSFLYRTVLSVLMVAIYVVYLAPDVAITEAMLGALLTTFVYLLSFKIHSKLKVAVVRIPVICQKYQDTFAGIIPKILEDFSKEYNHKIEYVEVLTIGECMKLIEKGEVDLGITFKGDFKILDVPYYMVNNKELSYFELINLNSLSEIKKISNKVFYLTFSDKNSIEFMEFSSFYTQDYLKKILKNYKLGGI
ncbi:hypothetical protein XJ44_00350 [Thermosipho affectus]|uniref:MrpA C-terminal/MbhD domain-containing protein n=1 Tax=Thermosipho affectus TaxID=660294 RepID=A0ABX3IND3_9BACT|nr:Na(+)/H(+) antiporter subunit B [Thermosipho affectus]ONN28032.1 hypothetical protein XJ44_00350 [Thermosipho affectus]